MADLFPPITDANLAGLYMFVVAIALLSSDESRQRAFDRTVDGLLRLTRSIKRHWLILTRRQVGAAEQSATKNSSGTSTPPKKRLARNPELEESS